MSDLLATLDAEVATLADEATPELLVRLLTAFLHEDRPGLVTCERHSHHLFPYVRAQINLTRAKRNYYRWADHHWPPICHAGTVVESMPETNLRMAEIARDNIRKTYRSTPCTCWVQHR